MNDAPRSLDPFAVPLRGVNLVEASAGTGKTHTITRLYLRLLLETGLRVHEILAVTYTTAATADMKVRIRELLDEARRALESGESPAEDALRDYLKARHADRKPDMERVSRALRDFDQAAIFTIHSFCQRVLSEQPLESGGSLEAELQPDESLVLRETADDFWRRRLAEVDPLQAGYLVQKKCTPDELLNGVRPWLAKPDLVLPGPTGTGLGPAALTYRDAWAKAGDSWRSGDRARAVEYLRSGPLRRDWYKAGNVEAWIGQLDGLFSPGGPPVPLMDKDVKKAVEKFSARSIGKAVKGTGSMPPLAFPPLAEALEAANDALVADLDQWHRNLHVDLLRYLNEELPGKKDRLRVLSYNDLLTRLREALRRDATLAGKIAARYATALVDEFQDTDPVQYEIFERIFVDTGRTVFLVGDPKQAIYSFRGADIFTYLAAGEAAENTFPLTDNYRSTEKMVQAVKTLFEKRRDAFVLDGITFQPSKASGTMKEELVAPDSEKPPFRIWQIEGDGEKALSREAAAAKATEATAREIVRLLKQGGREELTLTSGDHPRAVRGSDIAVLVPTHRHGRLVRKELGTLGVACVQHSQDNVFQTDEAADLERVLRAVAEPGREHLVRAALVTDLLGLDGRDLYDLTRNNEEEWGKTLAEFLDYHATWLKRGFMPMFRVMARARQVAPRLLAYRDGERRLTNLHHLAELLHAASGETGRAPERMIDWLALKRTGDGATDEAALLRLESDEDLVRIVTVHSSKGLQYPIVFCPFAWYLPDRSRKKGKERGVTWHDPRQENKEVLDVSCPPPAEVAGRAELEARAERLRSFYVSVTRARFRCYLVHGDVKGADDSALGWLLETHPGRETLEEMAALSGGALGVETLPDVPEERFQPREDAGVPLEPRRFDGEEVRPRWRVTSFSGLTSRARDERPAVAPEELPDHDQDAVEQQESEGRTRPGLPAGTRIGSCLHSLFEHLDFTDTDEGRLKELTARTLRGYGFDESLAGRVRDLVKAALDTPLDRAGAIRLREVDAGRRLNEMGFYYPVKALETGSLLETLRGNGLPQAFASSLERVRIETVAGFMNGFIDLVFEAGGRYYLADYKSNRLAGYDETDLTSAMAHSFYFLQYLIYTVALHRHLGMRLPGYDYERHFGGVFYLFLRGMDPARPGSGVFSDRPSRALVEALDSCLGDTRA